MLFVRQSDKGVNGKRGSRGKAKKLKVSRGAPRMCAHVRAHVRSLPRRVPAPTAAPHTFDPADPYPQPGSENRVPSQGPR